MTTTVPIKYEYKGRGNFEPAIPLKELVLKTIKELGPIKRKDLSKVMGVPRTTLYDALVKLMLDEQVRKYAVPQQRRGRPWVFYTTLPPVPLKRGAPQ
jgi:predicted ArsR family transcriptional regulator